MPKIDDVRTEGEMGSSATMEKAGVGDSDDDAATHHRCGACLVSLPDSCAPPSVLMNSFERRVMADLEAFRGVQQPRRISTSEMDAQVSHGEAVRASSTPVAARGITTYFKMGGEINLSKGQVEMFAYVFDSDLLPSEHIVKIGGSSATRQELFCLSKDHIITAKIMELWARKCTWEQRSITLKTTWCLPPSFSISENQVLITTTIDLVLGSSNELRKTIMDNASEHWFQLNELNQAYMICYLYTLVCGI
ncbi:hypothetical protein AHAS_Ahas02G0212600 [Arachis hypogaea]